MAKIIRIEEKRNETDSGLLEVRATVKRGDNTDQVVGIMFDDVDTTLGEHDIAARRALAYNAIYKLAGELS